MWYPREIVIKNLMAFEEQTYKFVDGQAVLVQGQNLTDDSQDSNGSCKSAILEAIGISLLGKCIRLDTSAKDLVTEGEKECQLEFYLENPTLKQTLRIKRSVFSNTKSSTLEIIVNDKPLTQITSVNEGNDRLLEIIGISREDLLNYYLISKERYVPFYRLADAKKKEVIGRFSNAHLIAPVEEHLDNNIKNRQLSIETIQKTIDTANLKIETFTGDMSTFNVEELQEKRDAKISGLKESILTYNQKIEEEEKTLKSLDNTAGDLEIKGQDMSMEFKDSSEEKLKELDTSEQAIRIQIDKYSAKLDSDKDIVLEERNTALAAISREETAFDVEMDGVKKELKEAEGLLAKVEKGLLASVECPKCAHEFSPGDRSLNIEKAKAKKQTIMDIISNLEGDVKEIRQDINGLDEKRSKIRTESSTKDKALQDQHRLDVADLREGLDEIDNQRVKVREDKKALDKIWEEYNEEVSINERKIRGCNRQITSFNEEITSLNKEITTVEEQVIKDRKLEFQEKIDILDKEVKEETEELEKAEGRLMAAKEEKLLFVRFKAHLSNKAIAAIELHSNNYLEIAKSNLSLQIDGYTQTKSGDIREKISTTVLRNGICAGGLGRYSSGEKARIEIANVLALKSMINNSSETGGLDLLVLDEVTNSLDSSGTGGVMRMLEETGEMSLLITHATFHGVAQNTVTVVKENGISTIIEKI